MKDPRAQILWAWNVLTYDFWNGHKTSQKADPDHSRETKQESFFILLQNKLRLPSETARGK